jgi:2-polyprenyl-3-methyl-5-hydroxy-6-metoxy-1,4-benzoquinol methylase
VSDVHLKNDTVYKQSASDLMMQKINILFSKLSDRFPWLYSVAYRLSFSPHRGMTWRFFDKSAYSVLDVGVFRGAFGRLIRLREKKRHFVVGIDRYRPYLDSCKQKAIYDALLLADGRHLPFREGAFDAVIGLEVIEHLPKADGLLFLEELERQAKRQIIVSTPVGFMEIHNLDSEYQWHLSGWFPSEFEYMEWKVRGMCGIRLFPKTLAYFMSFLIPLSYYVPACSYNMLCVKRKEN